MTLARTSIALPVFAALIMAGCGTDNADSQADGSPRVVEITMVDNAFEPTDIDVDEGEEVTLRFHNTGSTIHEAVLGDAAFQERHHDEMATSTTMSGMGAGDSARSAHGSDAMANEADEGTAEVIVGPGETADLTHTFDESGTLVIGCHQPGHWEAGMKATVSIR